ncbi:MAG TPA: hypothetical protein VGP79_03135 [Bryobacteraceae bacterium]|jgi:hypothetical protein|nr:hypothetical protein [Bryobacteraceae bacterium]
MRREETVCFRCDTKIPEKKSHVSWNDRCRTGLKIAFIFFAVLTVASLFTDMLPSFIKCLSVTFILMLVKSSADHMA